MTTAGPALGERRVDRSRWRDAGVAFLFIAGCQLAGLVGIPFTDSGSGGWYDRLDKPVFSPPDWVFAPAWTLLYALMGIAAFLVWRSARGPERSAALGAFAVQLVLNAAWTPIFFGAQLPGWALLEISVLLVSVAVATGLMWRVETVAGGLMVPYLGWVAFATSLNAAIVLSN